MPTIASQPGDAHIELAGIHVCPTCGKAAKSTVNRETSLGTLNTDNLCPLGHVWSVHWMGGAA